MKKIILKTGRRHRASTLDGKKNVIRYLIYVMTNNLSGHSLIIHSSKSVHRAGHRGTEAREWVITYHLKY